MAICKTCKSDRCGNHAACALRKDAAAKQALRAKLAKVKKEEAHMVAYLLWRQTQVGRVLTEQEKREALKEARNTLHEVAYEHE